MTADPTDPSGWMPGIEQIRTREFGYSDVPPDGMYPQAVMSHVMQGYQSTMLQWARDGNAGKSAHFTIGRGGRIVQHVSIWDPAWHAGDVNTPTSKLYAQLGGGNPNKFAIGIECEGFSIAPPYSYDYVYNTSKPWPPPLVESVIRIHQFGGGGGGGLDDAPDKAERVLTHSMTNSKSRAQDPGDLWLATVRPRIIAALLPAPPNPFTIPVATIGTGTTFVGGFVPTGPPPVPGYDLEGVRHNLQMAMVSLEAAMKKLGG